MEVRNYKNPDGSWERVITYWDLEKLAELGKEYVERGYRVFLESGCGDIHSLCIYNLK